MPENRMQLGQSRLILTLSLKDRIIRLTILLGLRAKLAASLPQYLWPYGQFVGARAR
jgi:hypothetical protein